MSYLFFIDESGHDHKNCPYEVRGGIVIHASSLWSFIQQFRDLEISSFGVELADFGVELKGSSLLKSKRFLHAQQGETLMTQPAESMPNRFYIMDERRHLLRRSSSALMLKHVSKWPGEFFNCFKHTTPKYSRR
jgi:hypothetical protein